MAKKKIQEKARAELSRDPARKNTSDAHSPTQRKLTRQKAAADRLVFYATEEGFAKRAARDAARGKA